MPLKTILAALFAIVAASQSQSVIAAGDDDARSQCEAEVQAYGITDEKELKEAIAECIANKQGNSEKE